VAKEVPTSMSFAQDNMEPKNGQNQELKTGKNQFRYKSLVTIPPLEMVDDLIAFASCSISSISLNTYINTKIETKKLKFSDKKCKKIHIGKENFLCPALTVHGDQISDSEVEKYLGSLLSKDCSNNEDIAAKSAKGMGLVAQIMAMLNDISLGEHYFEVAMLLREAIFINGILTSIEVSYGLTKANIKSLENVDKILLRKFLAAHSKTPIEALYLELGCLPIKYVIIMRRIMFLFYLLSRPDNELISQFFKAQSFKPTKND
jgi:hypothetical protein